jgi:hypothetical protein
MQIATYNLSVQWTGSYYHFGRLYEILEGEKRIHAGSLDYISRKWKKLTGRTL